MAATNSKKQYTHMVNIMDGKMFSLDPAIVSANAQWRPITQRQFDQLMARAGEVRLERIKQEQEEIQRRMEEAMARRDSQAGTLPTPKTPAELEAMKIFEGLEDLEGPVAVAPQPSPLSVVNRIIQGSL